MSFLWNSISRMANLFKVMWVVSQDVHCEKVWVRVRLGDHSVSCLQLWWRISPDCICMCVKCWVLGEFVLAFLESSKKGDYGSWQPKEPPVQLDRGLGFSSGGFLWAYWSQIYERFSTLVFDVMQRKKISTSRILSKVVILVHFNTKCLGRYRALWCESDGIGVVDSGSESRRWDVEGFWHLSLELVGNSFLIDQSGRDTFSGFSLIKWTP